MSRLLKYKLKLLIGFVLKCACFLVRILHLEHLQIKKHFLKQYFNVLISNILINSYTKKNSK